MKHYNVQQNTPEWDELRLGKITASNFGAIMANDGKAFGEPAKAYALQVALEMVCGRKSDYSFQNAHMERGHEMEPIARMRYEEIRFAKVDDGGFFSDGIYGGSPDGLVGADGLIEIKSVVAKVHFATIQRGSFDPSYRWQLIGNLWVTDRKWIDFVSYCSDFPEYAETVIFRLERDSIEKEIESLQSRLGDFASLVSETARTIRKLNA
jgi:hypothetical protein